MKYNRFVFFLFVLCLCSVLKVQGKDSVIIGRLKYVYNLKTLIDENIWRTFNDKQFDVPLIYYTDSNCYVVNPTEKFLYQHESEIVYKDSDVRICKTYLLDSLPFHMSTGIIFGDTVPDYNYRSPFVNSSSVEITQKIIPDVSSTEEWATMLLHEYFHGFQYKHSGFIDFFEKDVLSTSQNVLKELYASDSEFRNSIDEENDLLLSAIKSESLNGTQALVDSFFVWRDQRRKQIKKELKLDIKVSEETYETMEGTARYVEYSLYQMFAVRSAQDDFIDSDTNFNGYTYFRNFEWDKSQWLYMTNKTTYFYATGFNIARLLDKLNIEYKSILFEQGDASLENILRLNYRF